MSKAKYYRVIKPLTIAGREVLREGMFIKVQKQEDGTYVLVDHPMGYGGFSGKEELKKYAERIKKKGIEKVRNFELEILQDEINSLHDILSDTQQTLEDYEDEYDELQNNKNFLDKYLYL